MLCITPTMQLAWYSINVEGMGLKRMSQKGARLLICVGNEYLCIHQCPLSTSHQFCLLKDCSLVQLCGHSWFVKLKSLIIIRTIIDCFKSHEGLQGMELFITAQNQKFLLWFWLTTIEWWRYWEICLFSTTNYFFVGTLNSLLHEEFNFVLNA